MTAVADASEAELVVLNTCTVTHGADVDARRVIRGWHRDHPQAQILVTGCYAQRAPEDIAAIDGVRWVVGNSHKTKIAGIVADRESGEEYHGQVFVGDIGKQGEFPATPVNDVRADRTRPNLKVQDGCSNRCSFCIIPSVRGRSRSASLSSVVEQVRDLGERYCEIVLSGINLGRWGRDLPGQLRFIDLVKTLLAETSVRRLRISSVEPMDWSGELLELICQRAAHRKARAFAAAIWIGCGAEANVSQVSDTALCDTRGNGATSYARRRNWSRCDDGLSRRDRRRVCRDRAIH